MGYKFLFIDLITFYGKDAFILNRMKIQTEYTLLERGSLYKRKIYYI
jgi:hypothetical protein